MSLKYYRRAEQTVQQLLDAFRQGELPEPIAQIYFQRDLPMHKWTRTNQLLCTMKGCSDPRGYRQWQAAGRQVRKGERARAFILIPLRKTITKETSDGEEEASYLYGFTTAAMFDADQTEGEPLPYSDEEERFLQQLPLLDYARHIGLTVKTESAKGREYLGVYRPAREEIALATRNPATWLHELMHATDFHRGYRHIGKQEDEVAAELGGAVLGLLIGLDEQADSGGAWQYIQHQAGDEAAALQLCTQLLDHVCSNIDFILTTARMLRQPDAEALQATGG